MVPRILTLIATLGLVTQAPAHAAPNVQGAIDKEQMQQALNREVMSTPFNPGDIKRAQAYAEEARRQNLPPVEQTPAYWLPGWTCANLIVYPAYSYGDYRGCIYYHHVYGRYWR